VVIEQVSGSTRPVPVASGSRARQLASMAVDAPRFLQRTAARHGHLVQLKLGRGPVVLLTDPDATRAVLVDERAFPKGMGRGVAGGEPGDTPLRAVLGNGLLTSRGEHHRRQRRLIQPAFHHRRIASYADVMVAEAAAMTADWSDGATVDLHGAFAAVTLRVLTRTVFDVEVSGDDAAMIRKAVNATMRGPGANVILVSFMRRLGGRALATRREALADIDSMVNRLVAERRASADNRQDVLSWLLAAREDDAGRVDVDARAGGAAGGRGASGGPAAGGPATSGEMAGGAPAGGMTEQDIRDEVLTLLLAGHETSTNALSWAYHLLAEHPDVAAALHAELDAVLADGRAPTADDLPKLNYTRAVVDESMRLYPPAWMMVRHARDSARLADHDIEAGTTILMSPFIVHRDPDWWRDATTFDPTRWLTGPAGEYQATPQTRNAYFPFGGGPRMCIGNTFALMEIALVLAQTSRHWAMTPKPGHRVGMTPRVTLRPRGGMPMVVHAR
jgi:cytochrome P450